MKRLGTFFGSAFVLGLLICAAQTPARGEGGFTFDLNNYRQLTDASSAATIPPDTQIKLSNWQQYKQFMPVALQAAFSGAYTFHLTDDPMFTLVVKPTSQVGAPRQYLADGEKYGSQVRLVPAKNGGYTIEGWVAGPPFPNPAEPNIGEKLLYNTWAPWRPYLYHYVTYGVNIVDRFGNRSEGSTDATFMNLSHLSEPDMPKDLPFANGMFYVSRFEVLLPEQSKYTTELQQQPINPMRYPETYVFLPSLRRSLRLSSAAKCSPINGTDWVQDDNAWNPPMFTVTYLGRKKLLMNLQDWGVGSLGTSYAGGSYDQPPGPFPGWPKVGTGHWELRDTDVIDAKWIQSQGTYCFSHRIFYIDRQAYFTMVTEEFDNENKLWKSAWLRVSPMDVHGQLVIFIYGTPETQLVDWENAHMTIGLTHEMKLYKDVPAEYQDVQTLSQPGSLARIMK
jgi:Protein of unknown function (DUF1329)